MFESVGKSYHEMVLGSFEKEKMENIYDTFVVYISDKLSLLLFCTLESILDKCVLLFHLFGFSSIYHPISSGHIKRQKIFASYLPDISELSRMVNLRIVQKLQG